MNKKILSSAVFAILTTQSAFAMDINKATSVDIYGNVGATYIDSTDLFEFSSSHINVSVDHQFIKKHFIKANVGYRSFFSDKEQDFVYNAHADELYYNFVENNSSDFKIGRFYNPVGLYGKKSYDYMEHPFAVRENYVTSIDGIGLGFKSELQKHFNVEFDAFVGTQLSDSIIEGKEIEMDTTLNYGANAKFLSPFGNFNFGLYAANLGTDLVIDDVSVGIDEEPLFYQANLGYEYNKNNLYVLAEYNRIEYNYDDSFDNTMEAGDLVVGYKWWKLTPMIGFSLEKAEEFLDGDINEKEIIKLGLRFDINKNISILSEFNDINETITKNSDEAIKKDKLIKTDIVFKF